MKTKEFKKGDTVYWGTLKGRIEKYDCDLVFAIQANFENGECYTFTKDGRFLENQPQVLFHQPYELNFIEPQIKKDTLVWVRNYENSEWIVRYYSHFEDDKHLCFANQCKSTETSKISSWNFVSVECPLK